MPDAVEVLRPAEVPRRAAEVAERLIEHASQDWPDEVEVVRWYHDLPVWFVIETPARAGSLYRVLQITLVREAGQLWFELAVHRELRSDETLSLPYDDSQGVRVERLPLDRSAEELIEAAKAAWSGAAPDDPPDSASSPDWESIPLSPSLQKRS